VLSTLTVLAITTGIQAVGVVLMAALLITPAAAARSWTNALGVMLVLAAAMGATGGLVGSYISYAAPRMPTGPWMVMAISFIALISLLFAPRRGVFARIRLQQRNKQKIITENLLKALYQAGERTGNPESYIPKSTLLEQRNFPAAELKVGLRHLLHRHAVVESGLSWRLTQTGLTEAQRVVRLHRLWEMYLTERLNMRSDHIHANAETMEHLITPELETELMRELNYPVKDPHESVIPYKTE
jgi:manganese/zinc/iron transport system permease protein